MSATEFETALRQKIDNKTKPLGALGRIEDLAAAIARITGTLEPRMQTCQLTIFAGDHGLAREGVSAYPQEVTRQMLLNFLGGNAAANVFARSVGASLRVVDAGVAGAAGRPPRPPLAAASARAPATPCRAGDDRGRASTAPSTSAAPSAATATGTRSASAKWASPTPPPRRSWRTS